eukprot:gb/GEZJ01002124.1/.p1 GENE.gb/GEZJ01002124.1/~~gb/GEZJ01002124.1/.p1  ORF type:complete len:109 (-),score=3.56 gb/GEZJ01002124.1/:348-674(-)
MGVYSRLRLPAFNSTSLASSLPRTWRRYESDIMCFPSGLHRHRILIVVLMDSAVPRQAVQVTERSTLSNDTHRRHGAGGWQHSFEEQRNFSKDHVRQTCDCLNQSRWK